MSTWEVERSPPLCLVSSMDRMLDYGSGDRGSTPLRGTTEIGSCSTDVKLKEFRGGRALCIAV